MNAMLRFRPMLARIGTQGLVALALSLVTLAAGIGLLGVSGWFLTAAALSTAGSAFNIFGPSAAVRALSFVRILARYGEKLTGHNSTLKLLSDLRQWLFARLFPIVPFGGQFGRADLVSRLIADIDALDTVLLLALGPITTALLSGTAMTLGLLMLMPAAAGWYAAAFFASIVLVPMLLLAMTRRAGAAALEAAATLRRLVLDGLDGHQDLVVFGALARSEAEMARATQALGKARRTLGARVAMASGATQLLSGVAIIGTLLAGLSAYAAGHIDGPLLAGLLLAVIASFEASAMLVRSTTRLAGAAAAAKRLEAIVDLVPAIAEPTTPHDPGSGGAIGFANVRFGYDPARPFLDDISFAVAGGACVAITGASGAGKSTIAQLLVRLADPQGGSVTLNGVDVRAIDTDTLRRHVALMTQDAPVFLDTIGNNLLIGNPAATDAELTAALEAVRLSQFVDDLPDGLATLVGEAGRTLSAGQARRLCLARSLLGASQVLILDEPTSGLDGEAEAAFLSDLRRLGKGRTIIVITHAALPAGAFDRVLELKAGQIMPAA